MPTHLSFSASGVPRGDGTDTQTGAYRDADISNHTGGTVLAQSNVLRSLLLVRPCSSAMASKATRLRALALYKELHRLGRDYPDPACVSVPLSPSLLSRPYIDPFRTVLVLVLSFQSSFKSIKKYLRFDLTFNTKQGCWTCFIILASTIAPVHGRMTLS